MYKTGKFYIKLAVPDGTTFPTHASIETGSIFYRNDERLLYIYSGDWQPIPVYSGIPNTNDTLRWNGNSWIPSGVGIGTFLNLTIEQQAHIIDANGTLADATTKINAILVALETYGLLATS